MELRDAAILLADQFTRQAGKISDSFVNDRHLLDQVHRINAIKQFLIEEKVCFDADKLSSIDLSSLNKLKYHPFGRSPTKEEWNLLDTIYCSLVKYLSPDLKRKMRIQELSFYFGPLPMIFFFIALTSTGLWLESWDILANWSDAPFNVVWTGLVLIWSVSQGGLGACAFLGTSAIIQTRKESKGGDPPPANDHDSEFSDITDRNFLKIRIIMGCLFGFLLGLPFADVSLNTMYNALSGPNNKPTAEDIAMLLVPFLVGFSTNLVLTIVNRVVSAIQTMFGVSARN